MDARHIKEETDKYIKVMELYTKIMEEGKDDVILNFFDIDDEKNLDKKIRVLTEVLKGKDRDEIKGYYDILTGYDRNALYDI